MGSVQRCLSDQIEAGVAIARLRADVAKMAGDSIDRRVERRLCSTRRLLHLIESIEARGSQQQRWALVAVFVSPLRRRIIVLIVNCDNSPALLPGWKMDGAAIADAFV